MEVTRNTGRRRWFGLALLCSAFFMVILDVAIVNVALPSIQADLEFSPTSELLLHERDQPDQAAQPAVVLRLVRQMRKPARQGPPDQAEELPVRRDPDRRLTDSKRDQLRIRDLRPATGTSRDPILVREHIACNNEGFQIGRHLELLSRGDTTGSPTSRSNGGSLPRNPPFHIKPLAELAAVEGWIHLPSPDALASLVMDSE